MTPEPQEIGHQVRFPNTLLGLFKRGCWEIPEIMGASAAALVGLGLALVGLHNYKRNNGENREFKAVYTIVRPEDPRACHFKNPARTKYP